MPEYSIVGQRLSRVDVLDKVTGRALYSADITLPGMLYGKVLRSPYAHARVLRLDVSKARALTGVMAVITAADASGDELVKEKAVFAGQPVAAVAAINPDVAEEALGLIVVDYEELTPVVDVLEAIKPDAPLIHPNLYTEDQTGKCTTPSNISWHIEFKRGDVEAGFREADVVLENTFRTQTVNHGYLEPRAAVASIDLKGKITVWTGSQGIFSARAQIASFLKSPLSRIKVVPVEVGGGFGGKGVLLIAPLCALLSQKTGQPVKMVMTREEDLRASRVAPSSAITLRMGATKEGRITAASATVVYDDGAFPQRMPSAQGGSISGLGPYNIPNLKVDGYDVVTNKLPSTAYRAPASPQAAFAVESQLDLLAKALEMDPLKFRIKNAVEKGDLMPNGVPFPKIGFKETLEKMAKYLEQRGKLEGESRGRGIACGLWRGGVGSSAAHVNMNADGSVVLIVGSVDLTGSRTSLSQMVAEEFGIPFDEVSVVSGDTETAPYSDITAGSRTTHQMGSAVYHACQDIKAQLARLAIPQLGAEGAEPGDIEFVQGRVQVKGMPEKFVSLADLAWQSVGSSGEGPITGRGSVKVSQSAPMFAVQAADVEVDRETGKVKILSYAAAQDVGLAVNPTLVEGQIQGAVSQGIGWALMENYVFQEGVMQNATLLDYRIPTAVDLPFVETILVEVSSAAGPYGVRGVGEPPIVPTLATIANAIHSAVGVRLKEPPMTPEAVFWALREQEKSKQAKKT
jgi:CO/xanthine dehydrogenase Mo-binding subunit